MGEFNLEYYEKSTGRKFFGKGLPLLRVKVRSEDGAEEMILTKDQLSKRFKGSKMNRGHAFRKKVTALANA